MSLILDAFWRALAYCLHPRVILLSLAPLLLTAGLCFVLGWFYWEAAVDAVDAWLRGWALVNSFTLWLESMGATGLRAVMAPLIVVALAVPVIVVVSLMAVSALMTPALVRLVGARRFPQLQRRQGDSFWRSLLWMLGHTLVALVALVISLPLWLIPPLALVLPPLIWGWLTYRVLAFDALADHAERAERRALMREHRWPLLGMGLLSGYLGAAPALLWALGALAFILAPLLVVVSVWLYTLVFAFSSLWFIHYALAALERRRHQADPCVASVEAPAVSPPEAVPGAGRLEPPAGPGTPD
ncbi:MULTISPECIES: EI24 domain-containing protein [Caldimonas]|uniref:EI24 domain-containing protein n=1 Tax=Caldimonas TaxID=196013 RepID=UPI00037B4461|nr:MULTISPECIES: EI24 domain-containing protein [Caldimonas]MCX7659523.1 EI24 domain-containing protein [Caldimonas manganoxidans]GIX23566.1 MAG: membrane protein [Caldimonas sp.]